MTGSAAAPLRLLLSAATQAALGATVQQAAAHAGRALQLLRLEDVVHDDSVAVHAAYISRDITGLSTKHEVLAPLAGCYRVLRRSPQLQWLHTHSAGTDRPIYGELQARGVHVSTSAGANAEVVAQTALGAVLALARRFPQAMAAQARCEWAPLVAGALPPDLSGQQAVVVGWGGIGQRLHAWLTMLGLQVSVARHSAAPAGPGIATVRYAQLGQLLPQAQWLLLACPLTADTQGLLSAALLQRLPAGAMLVNVARGEVLDQAALTAALATGHLGGAFLDVFEHEPLPPGSPLWRLPNVMVSPHSAGQAAGNAARAAAKFTEQLACWLRGDFANP